MGEPLTEAELGALAEVFHDKLAAELLLASVDFPRARFPAAWTDSLMFWQQVSHLLVDGVIANGRARVVAAARKAYPAHPIFGSVGESPGTPAGPAPGPGAGDSPPPHKLDRWVEAKYREAVEDAVREVGLVKVPRLDHADLAAAREEARSKAASSPGLLRHAQLLGTLADAAAASRLLTELGHEDGRTSRTRLIGIYSVEVDRLPEDGGSLDLLLVEAANAVLNRQPDEDLDALSRFVLAVAAELPVDPADEALTAWIRSMGHKPFDGRQHLKECRSAQPAWLIIDLDDERSPEEDQWPRSLSAQLYKGDKEWSVRRECHRREDLRKVLQDLLRRLPLPGTGLIVDIAAPRALFAERVERLKVLDVGRYEALAKDCRPRLRWSRRLRDERLRERARNWARGVDWTSAAVVVPPGQAWNDEDEVTDWLRARWRNPLVLGSGTTDGPDFDLLCALLFEGCGFILWFDAPVDDETRQAVAALRTAVVEEAVAAGRARADGAALGASRQAHGHGRCSGRRVGRRRWPGGFPAAAGRPGRDG